MVDLPDGAEPSSLDQEDSVEGGGTGDGEVMLRSRESPPGIERRRSYQMATEDMEMLDACLLSDTKADDDDDDDDKFVESPKHTKPDLISSKQTSSETIKRSISSVETASMAAIKRRKNMNIPKAPRALSTACVSSNHRQSASSLTSAHDSAYNSLKRIMSPQSSLEQLIDREISSGSYSTPLIGCIPPSALKCFAGEKKDPKNGSAVSPLSSPAHSQSGKRHAHQAVKKTILCC